MNRIKDLKEEYDNRICSLHNEISRLEAELVDRANKVFQSAGITKGTKVSIRSGKTTENGFFDEFVYKKYLGLKPVIFKEKKNGEPSTYTHDVWRDDIITKI